jgi:hypothetical protein
LQIEPKYFGAISVIAQAGKNSKREGSFGDWMHLVTEALKCFL